MLKRYLVERDGAVAVIFGLLAIPLFGVVGLTLDYNRAESTRSLMQSKADAAALNVAVNGQGYDDQETISALVAEIQNIAGNALSELSITGNWISSSDYRIVASGNVDTAMVHVLPGVDRGLAVGIETVARVDQWLQYQPPEFSDLNPDAGDYNEMYVYCFDYDGWGPKSTRRSQFTLFADNVNGVHDLADDDWPVCAEGESLSFMMRNVRHAKAHPEVLHNPNQPPYYAEYNFYTDTTLIDGVEHFDINREVVGGPSHGTWGTYNAYEPPGSYDILQTVLCDTKEECVGESEGGLIPEGKNMTPQIANAPCEPGKYMYYGWEDRPPDMPGDSANWTDPAWTDRSYDDIRILMRCPLGGGLGDRTVLLVK